MHLPRPVTYALDGRAHLVAKRAMAAGRRMGRCATLCGAPYRPADRALPVLCALGVR